MTSTMEKVVTMLLLAIAVPYLVVYFAPWNNNFGHFVPSINSLQGISSSLIFMNESNTPSSSGDFDQVHDEHYELRKMLKEASTEDKTVIVATLNEAWAEPNSIFDLFLESFRSGNNTARFLNHLLVIAVDEKAYSRCRETVSHCYHLKTNQSGLIAHEATFMTPSYKELVWTRLAFLQTMLSFGYNFLQTDTDVMWFRDPFPHFNKMDFQTSCDQYNGNPFDLKNMPNNGFIFVRSNNRTIEFYKFWVASRWKYSHLHEQDAFNMIKHDPYVKQIGMQIRFLDTDYFGGFCSPSKDISKVCTMHSNCCVGLHKKLADLHTTLEDWKMYQSFSVNATKFHWRVPHQCHM